MITRSFALKLFEGFFIQRWNDMPRPMDLVEMDRVGNKMVIAYLLGRICEEDGEKVEWEKIIYGGIFELLKKIILSDIKAPVHRIIKEKHKQAFTKLNNWVVENYKGIIIDEDLLRMFTEYLINKEDMTDISFRILRAAHKYSTFREFELLRHHSINDRRILQLEEELNHDLQEFLDLRGMQLLLTKQPPYGFVTSIEELRYQLRWSQTPRVPRTSVLGHSAFVAALSLLITRELSPCNKRLYNNYYCGLFHDLPETVTRDIVHPAKKAITGLDEIIKGVENELVSELLVPLMIPIIRDEIIYFTQNEFDNRIIQEGRSIKVNSRELSSQYNANEYSPVDGELIYLCDQIGSLLEADQSIELGISSKPLQDGRKRIIGDFQKISEVSGINITSFFSEFP